MNVEVEHGLPGVGSIVDDGAEAAIHESAFVGELLGYEEKVAEQRFVSVFGARESV